ncbi:spinster family MFS transporter [Xanthobacter agilis]|jgi:predicted MFS family arabinose efflux permease|uniref:spinster family MFS transporter n=1 Tax=Xanthobacter agilis TaxID=47492 RepID=UPI003729D452
MKEDTAAPRPAFEKTSALYKVWLLVLLVLVYACSFLDRIVIAVLARPIKADLGLSDFQVGLLGGLSFALVYTVAGLPLGRLAERTHRVRLIAVCIVIWSAFAALCGMAANFWQMVLFRAGVGIGEAGCTPAAHSLIGDQFPPHRRATALAVYALGVPIGVLAAAFGGGWLAQTFGWRYAFIILGLPGILLGVLTFLTLREPARGRYDGAAGAASAEVPPFSEVLRRLWAKRAARHMIIGTAIGAFGLQAINQFIPIYLGRIFGMSLLQAGFTFGITVGVGGFIGIALGGYLSDLLAHRDKRWYSWVPGFASVLGAPVAYLAFAQSSETLAIAGIFLFLVLVMSWNGPTFAVVHAAVHPRMRASSTAVVLLVMSLIGHGLGPAAIGLVSDTLAGHAFTGTGAYLAACAGPAASNPQATACAAAAATGIRLSMICFTVFLVWAGLHYLWAARSLREDTRATDLPQTRPAEPPLPLAAISPARQ